MNEEQATKLILALRNIADMIGWLTVAMAVVLLAGTVRGK